MDVDDSISVNRTGLLVALCLRGFLCFCDRLKELMVDGFMTWWRVDACKSGNLTNLTFLTMSYGSTLSTQTASGPVGSVLGLLKYHMDVWATGHK